MNFIFSKALLKIFPFVIFIFLSLGCAMMETVESTKIPQSEIRQTYIVRATRERTNITAYFNHGSWGKSVDLDGPSKVEDNDRELRQSSVTFLRGTVYEMNLAGVQTSHRFVYTNNDGKTFQNELSFEPLDLPAGEISISRSQETKIQLSRIVGKDENIAISLKSLQAPPGNSNSAPAANKTGAKEEDDLSLNNELDANRSAIILKPKNLKTFVNGKAVLNVEVSRELSLEQQNQAGGTMRWSYSSMVEASVAN